MSTFPEAASGEAHRVLAKAIVRTADALGLSQRDLSDILGCSQASVSRIHHGRGVDPSSSEGELGLMLIRSYRALADLLGGNEDAVRAWMHAHHDRFGTTPAEHAQSIEGLVHVVAYLEAMRSK